ncbi:MAG: DUF4340 domain-containing protein [Candidatus Omnitrophica bacterium]|nr:DUF4340 domain-containing protein [Candidatus Omnitrophota bacterium]
MKQSLLIFGVVAVLLVGLWVMKNARNAREERELPFSGAEVYQPAFDPKTVTEVVIASPKVNIHCRKDKDAWQVVNVFGGMPADPNTVTTFLNSFTSVRGEMRSADPSLLKAYGVSDADGLRIQIFAAGKLLEDLYLGAKATQGKRDNFLRRAGSSVVYVIPDDVLNFLGIRPDAGKNEIDRDQWLDKKIMMVDTAAVTGLDITDGGKPLVALTKDAKGAWLSGIRYPFGVDTAKVNGYLDMLGNLRAFAVTAPEAFVFDDKSWTLKLKRATGEALAIQRGAKDDGTFYLKVSGKEYLYKVAVYHFSNLGKTAGDFFTTNPFGFDEKKVSLLKIDYAADKKKLELLHVEGKSGDGLEWKTAKGESFPAEKVEQIVQMLKNLPLLTPGVAQPRSDMVLSFSLRQDKETHDYRIRNNTFKDPQYACFPLMIDKLKPEFCLEEGQMRSLTAAVDALSRR